MSCHRAKWRENCVVRIKRKLRPRCGPFRAKYLSVSGFFVGGGGFCGGSVLCQKNILYSI